MSGWLSSENMFVAPIRKGETLPKLADLLKTNFSLSSRKENLSPQEVCPPCGTKVRNCSAMLSQIREKLNTPTDNEQLLRLKRMSKSPHSNPLLSWFGSVNHYPWEFKHPAVNGNELGPAWQNRAGKSHIHGHKENRLELCKSRRNFGKIRQPKTVNQRQWRTLHFLKRQKKKMLLHQRANHADQRKSICVSRPLSMKYIT